MTITEIEELAAPNPATTNWVQVNGPAGNLGGGYEFGYDQITAPVPLPGTTEGAPTMVIPGSPHTFDGNPVQFEFQAPYVQTDAVANSYCYTALFEGSTEIAKLSITAGLTAAQNYGAVRASVRITPSAGLHTYSVKGWSTSGTGIVGAGAGGTNGYAPAYLRATSVSWYSGPGIGMPSPVVNGQWIKGAGGAAIWAPITPADVGLPKITRGTFAAGPPASPADGDIWIANQITSQSNTIDWQFAWEAGAAWRFIGGPPVTMIDQPNLVNGDPHFALAPGQGAGGWVYSTAIQFTPARGGVYLAQGTVNFTAPGSSRNGYVAMFDITSGNQVTGNIYTTMQAGYGATVSGMIHQFSATAGHKYSVCVYCGGSMDVGIYALNAIMYPIYIV